jgi:glycosyltransferase involved in cell wall biosynthesis
VTEPTNPRASVLIATHNRVGRLTRCLQSLAGQEVDPTAFEVIVADDGSDDGSPAAIEALEMPFELQVLRLPKGGKSAAVNAAIERARGAVCILLDDDVIAVPGLIAAYLSEHEEHPMTLGLGSIHQQPVEGKDWYAHAFAAGWNRLYAERTGREAGWQDCFGANMSAPLAALKEAGGLRDLPTAEDIELGYRLTKVGCTPRFVPAAHVVHDDQKPSTRMLAEMRLQGRTHVEVAREHPELRPTLFPWNRHRFRGERRLRMALVRIHTPARAMATLGPLVPRRYKSLWSGLIKDVAFWRGVREVVDDAEWASLTRESQPTAEAEG